MHCWAAWSLKRGVLGSSICVLTHQLTCCECERFSSSYKCSDNNKKGGDTYVIESCDHVSHIGSNYILVFLLPCLVKELSWAYSAKDFLLYQGQSSRGRIIATAINSQLSLVMQRLKKPDTLQLRWVMQRVCYQSYSLLQLGCEGMSNPSLESNQIHFLRKPAWICFSSQGRGHWQCCVLWWTGGCSSMDDEDQQGIWTPTPQERPWVCLKEKAQVWISQAQIVWWI